MSWILPLDIGLVMGLILAWPVLGFASSFRLLSFPDLTLEGSFPAGAAVTAVALVHGWPVPLALGSAMIAGACLGALTAVIHIHFRVNKFLAGIIVVAISYTLALRIMNAPNIGLIRSPSLFDLVSSLNGALNPSLQLGNILLLSLLLLAGCAGILIAINTLRGTELRVAGSNAEYASALGINISQNVIVGLATTNSLVAGAGGLLAMYQGFSDIGMGQGVLILALASMTIGERVVPERSLAIPTFVVVSAVIGSLIYEILIAYAVRLGLAATDLKLATAVFVLGVIAVRVKRHDDGFLEVIR